MKNVLKNALATISADTAVSIGTSEGVDDITSIDKLALVDTDAVTSALGLGSVSPPGSDEANAAGAWALATDTVAAGASSFSVAQSDNSIADNVTDTNVFASSGMAAAQSSVSLFHGDSFNTDAGGVPGSTGSLLDGAYSFATTSTNLPGSTSVVLAPDAVVADSATPAPLAANIELAVTGSDAAASLLVGAGATLEIDSSYSGTVSFASDTGTLKIDNPSTFTGKIGGQLAIGDTIDLAGINAANATISYSGDNSPGTLTVSDGTHTANIALAGNYTSSNFTAYDDGHGGTMVIDPPSPVGTGFDANGWTTFNNQTGPIIYVSSSTGNDSNSGLTPGSAVSTIAEGLKLLQQDGADQLLLKAGDTWVNQEFGYLDFSGKSATDPILISSYGTGAAPLIETPTNGSGTAIGSIGAGTGSNIAVVGLDFYAYTRDPSNPHYAGPTDYAGMDFENQLSNLLIENTTFNYYSNNVVQQIINPSGGMTNNVTLHRDVIENNYSVDGHSEGLYVDRVSNLVLDGNVFDHNGWNSSIAGAEPNIFNQGIYIQYDSGAATVVGNIIANSADYGLELRSGGTAAGNLFVHNPLGMMVFQGGAEYVTGNGATVTGNVFTEANDINAGGSSGVLPRGYGLVVQAQGLPIQATNNIFTQEASAFPWGQAIQLAGGTTKDTVTNNIIHSWNSAISDGGSGNITSPNAINLTGYVNPNVTVESYNASLGGPATLAAFLAAAESQTKANWNPQYTAAAVDAYIAAGFTMAGASSAPTIASFSTDSGVLGDHITNDTTLTLTGTAVANSTVNVFDGATLLGSVAANSSGAWSYNTATLANGAHSFTATDTVSGTTSAASTALSVTVDTAAPAKPVIASFSPDSGTVGDGITSASILTLTGTAEANSSVKVYDGATLLGSATANASGAWSYTTAALSNATHGFTATATDAAGNTGVASTALNVTVSAPLGVPTIASFSTDSGVVGDGITNDTTLTLTGTAVANSTVNVFDGATLLGSVAANSSGAWSYTTAALSNATHGFTATDTVSGTTSAASTALSVTVDTAAPAKPVIASFSPDSGTVGDGITSASILTLTGTAEANSSVKVYDGATLLGSATANASGAWSYTTAALSNATHGFTATATDAAGNTGVASTALNVTVSAPQNLVANGSFETDNFTGWTLGGQSQYIYIVNTAESGQFAAGMGPTGADGTLSQTLQTTAGQQYTLDFWLENAGPGPNDFTAKWNGQSLLALVNASAQGYTEYTYTVTATGSTSQLEFDFRQDPSEWHLDNISVTASGTLAPPAPAITAFSPDTGIVGDGITDPAILTLTGTAVANSTVNVYDGTTLLGTAAANGTGAWSFVTAPLPDGAHSLTATDTVSGTTSAASVAMSVTVDTVAPVAPSIASFSTDSGVVGDHITNDNTLTLTGSAEANSTVKVYDGATLLGSATANSSGAWTYTTAALSNGAHSLTATATDAAANTGVASSALSVTVDTVAPVAPSIASFSTDSGVVGDHITNDNTLTLTGSAEANSTVKVYDGATLLGSSTANGSGAWTYTTAALSNGAHNLTATATDAAGNTGVASAALSVTVDTVAPVAPSIASFSTDSGVVGDHITNDNTLTLTGSAEANSTVKVYDGATLLGSSTANGSGAWTYTTAALSDGAHNLTATATDAAGNTGVASAALSVTVDTVAPNAPVIASDAIINTNEVMLTGSAEANSAVSIYEAATLLGTATVNSSGVWSYATGPLSDGPHTFNVTATDAAGNTSSASQSVDPITGKVLTIETNGSTSLTEIGSNFYLYNSGGSGPALSVAGVDVVAGQYGGWMPIGAEQTATGYEVAWKVTGTNQYSVWTTDSNGNYTSNSNIMSGTSATLESLETSFHQDLNGDGIIGLSTTTIESIGSTSLVEVANNFFLDSISSGSGPALQVAGVDVTGGQFGGWTPIGVEQTASGYEVAWKVAGADQYSIWTTDSNGNYTSNTNIMSGASTTLEALEVSFHQDLNGDGVIGMPPTTIESAGSTSVVETGNNFFLDSISSGSGPSLKVAGVDVVLGQFGGWTPIGAEQTSSGYEVAWKVTGADQFSVWTTDSNGNYISNNGVLSGTSPVLQSLEASFHQDLNGDGVITTTVLDGHLGSQTLTASSAPTSLFGGPNDILNAGTGADIFVFQPNSGSNAVNGFKVGTDSLEFSQSTFATAAAALSHAQQVGSDVVISSDPLNMVTLHNTLLANLHATDIHIV